MLEAGEAGGQRNAAGEEHEGREELLGRQRLRRLLLLLPRVARPRQPEAAQALQVPCGETLINTQVLYESSMYETTKHWMKNTNIAYRTYSCYELGRIANSQI